MAQGEGGIVVTGASGFVGQHLVSALRERGEQVRAFVRSPQKAERLKKIGCEIVTGDVTAPESIERALHGSRAVFHLVGLRRERGRDTYDRVNFGGTKNVIAAMMKTGVSRLIYTSIVKTTPDARCRYLAMKWREEQEILHSRLSYTIFRAAVIYGPGGEGFTNLVNLVKRAPVLPVLGSGRYKMQPLYVKDMVAALLGALNREETQGKTYEIGGPDPLEFNTVLDTVAAVFGKKRLKIHIPVALVQPFLKLGEKILPPSLLMITNDELEILLVDTICDVVEVTRTFGLSLVPLSEGIRVSFT